MIIVQVFSSQILSQVYRVRALPIPISSPIINASKSVDNKESSRIRTRDLSLSNTLFHRWSKDTVSDTRETTLRVVL